MTNQGYDIVFDHVGFAYTGENQARKMFPLQLNKEKLPP